MSVSNQKISQCLFQFDDSFEVSYVNYFRGNELTEPRLVITLERDNVRHTFAFAHPRFQETARNLISSRGLYIANVRPSPFAPTQVEVGDLSDGLIFLCARNVKNLTPSL